jgi:hypothetical protein
MISDSGTCPTTFTVAAAYKLGAKQIEEHHVIDMRPYLHGDIPQDPVIRKLKTINDSLDKLAGAVKRAP